MICRCNILIISVSVDLNLIFCLFEFYFEVLLVLSLYKKNSSHALPSGFKSFSSNRWTVVVSDNQTSRLYRTFELGCIWTFSDPDFRPFGHLANVTLGRLSSRLLFLQSQGIFFRGEELN